MPITNHQAPINLTHQKTRVFKVKDLRPHALHPCAYGEKDIALMIENMKEFGECVPLVTTSDRTILLGVLRWLAAQRMNKSHTVIITMLLLHTENRNRCSVFLPQKLSGWLSASYVKSCLKQKG